jgi:hypothetical protein
MAMIGSMIMYPDGFTHVDIIVRKVDFEVAKAVIEKVNNMIETNDFYADIFDPKTDYVKCLEKEKIDACVLRVMTHDDEIVFPFGKTVAEFMVDLDTGGKHD